MQLQATLDAIPDLLFEVDLDGRIYGYHSHRSDLLALPPDEFLNRCFSEILPPDVTKVCDAAILEASAKGWSTGAQYALTLPLGERWFEISVALKPGAEHAQRFIFIARDITERKLIELELERHQDHLEGVALIRSVELISSCNSLDAANTDLLRFKAIVDSSIDAIICKTLSGIITSWNKAAQNIFGYTAQESLGKPMLMLIPPGRESEESDILSRVARNEQVAQFETVRRHKDGRLIPISANISPVLNESGKVIGVAKIARDITAAKKAEQALRTSLLRQNAVFASSPDAMLISDAQGLITQANQQVEGLLGYTADELIGLSIETLVPQKFRGAHPKLRDKFTDSPVGRRMGHGLAVKARRKDGGEADVEVSLSRIETDLGFLFVSSLHDISERRKAEEQLRVAAAAFESQEGIVVTDASGTILRVNRAFSQITGYSADEVVGQNPRLLQSGRHDAAFFRDMWECIGRTVGWQGEIWDRRKNGEIYPKWLTISAVKGHDGAVTHYVGTHSDISARKEAEQRVHTLAFFDPLTGLPNRTLLMDRLRQAMAASDRADKHGALLFIDLDNFKSLNDTQGHDVGDLLLKQVAERLKQCVREGDTVARLGGDEFVVVLANLSGDVSDAAIDTETVASKIIATLNLVYRFGTASHHSTASMGATLFKGSKTSTDDLIKQTDLTMYKAKDAGRNTFRFFNPAMELALKERAALESDLRMAVDKHQFLLHYQVQVTDSDQVTGAEVLLRWQHPQRGMVSPADFIPMAESTGLILPLGHWVLETACSQLALWASQPAMAHLTVVVNVSAHQFRQSDFVDQVLQVLASTGANPQRLKLELTESMLVDNMAAIIETMITLKGHGIGFSLDDFGTGYSSLSYLKRLPLDQLKIDRSFVRDVLDDHNDAAIARTIVALSQGLGLGVIAEGVETLAQRDFLAAAGCHAYQGYFFSRPLPLKAFEEFVRGR
jgi:diguanylate cyclase (GGDEF)-like protein/PAS domain S-box-containing protein